MAKRRRSALTILIVIFAGVIVAWLRWPVGRAFDARVWQDEKQVQQGVRLAMADRIVARRMLLGKSRAQVTAMLGEPPETVYFPDWDLVYWLGPERAFISIDSEWLVVRFDSNERVSEYRIVHD